MHWHEDRGQLIPACVEVRCYGVEDENEGDFWGGQERPNHALPIFSEGESSRSASSELLGKRIRWGRVLGEHAAELSAMLADSASETASLHAGSSNFMRNLSLNAAGLARANDETYRVVAALYLQALSSQDRARPALFVMNQLIERGYALDHGNSSDRVKVRQWIGEARKRGYLPKTERRGTGT